MCSDVILGDKQMFFTAIKWILEFQIKLICIEKTSKVFCFLTAASNWVSRITSFHHLAPVCLGFHNLFPQTSFYASSPSGSSQEAQGGPCSVPPPCGVSAPPPGLLTTTPQASIYWSALRPVLLLVHRQAFPDKSWSWLTVGWWLVGVKARHVTMWLMMFFLRGQFDEG